MERIASGISSRSWSEVLRIDDLCDDRGLEPFLDRTFYEIDLAPEEVFEIKLAVHVVVEGFLSFPEQDQYVHITIRPLLSAYK